MLRRSMLLVAMVLQSQKRRARAVVSFVPGTNALMGCSWTNGIRE